MPSTKEKMPGETYCFACGPDNPIGLHLDFHFAEEKYVAEKTLPHEYQSYEGVVHGGIVTTMLDEAMGGYLYSAQSTVVRASSLRLAFFPVSFSPVPLGTNTSDRKHHPV